MRLIYYLILFTSQCSSEHVSAASEGSPSSDDGESNFNKLECWQLTWWLRISDPSTCISDTAERIISYTAVLF